MKPGSSSSPSKLLSSPAGWAPALKMLPLLLVLLSLPDTARCQFLYSTFNGVITITGYTGPGGSVTIPRAINGLPVVKIMNYAFESCTNLTNVTISDTVTNLGYGAFYGCTSLTNVTIPDSVTDIGYGAFYGCSLLTSVTIPRNVTSVGTRAFEACTNLTTIKVDGSNPNYCSVDGVLLSGTQSMIVEYPCGKAGSYTIPGTVSSIGDSAFASCYGLTSVTIGNDVSSIGAYSFYDCTNLVNVAGGDGIDSIGPYAFFGCIGLSSVPIGSNVTTIEGYAFSSCAALTIVTIPRSLTNIGRGAFTDCIRLTSITVDALNPIYCSVGGVLFNGDQTRIVLYPGGKVGSYTVPATVTNIGDFAFASCYNLTNVTIGNHVTIMGSEAFSLSTNLTGVYFYGDVPDIPYGLTVFSGADRAIVYYLPGKAGWDQFFGGCRTALWQPQVLASDASFGVPTNQFGFNINWASNMTVIVDASTDLSSPLWVPVRTNILTDGLSYFSDPDWTNYPCRFYRVRTQ